MPLTAPQLLVLEALVERLRADGGGASLSELSRRVGLAHSTVSGIVVRLERGGLVTRSTRAEDRRFLSIELTAPVRVWIERDLSAARLRPLASALAHATPDERSTVLAGLDTLERLLRQPPP